MSPRPNCMQLHGDNDSSIGVLRDLGCPKHVHGVDGISHWPGELSGAVLGVPAN